MPLSELVGRLYLEFLNHRWSPVLVTGPSDGSKVIGYLSLPRQAPVVVTGFDLVVSEGENLKG